MSRLAIANQLLKDQMFEEALLLLNKEENTLDTLTLRSYLLRYLDRYDEEGQLLETAVSLNLSSSYLETRQTWHKLPLFDRLVPRDRLWLPKNPQMVPCQETLDQLCFVTSMGSDQPYFNLGIELLESIKNTKLYKDIPICILDGGLTEEDKHYLVSRFGNVEIKDPGFDIDIPNMEAADFRGVKRSLNGLKGCLARPFIPKHFPNYRYYVWFDTDVWIQDERSLDLFIVSAEQHGVSSVIGNYVHRTFQNSWWHSMCNQYGLIPPHQLAALLTGPSLSAGTLCIDVQSGFFDLWAKYMKEAVDYSKQVWGPDEITFTYAIHKDFSHAPVLEFEHNYTMSTAGLPIWNDTCLTTPYSAEPIGMIHMTGYPKEKWFAPLVESRYPVSIEQNKQPGLPRKNYSIHFRTWPWADKTEIRSQLITQLENLA